MPIVETNKNYSYGKGIVLSQLLLLTASFGQLIIGNQLTSYLFFIAIFLIIVLLIQLSREYFFEFITFILILGVSLSPVLFYGESDKGILFFGSAYSVDFQQYLSVAFSLSNGGLPLQNPYWPGVEAFYHYGYLLPFAGLLNLLGQENGSFFFYSYSFVCYSATTNLLLFFVIRLFFFKSFKCALLAICVGLFASSYKAIYAIFLVSVSGLELSGYDTPIGFKTFQNDMMFGPHYLYSGIFFLYILHVISRNFKAGVSNADILYLMLISFLTPVINGFSPIILASLFGGYFMAKYFKTPFDVFNDKTAWALLVCLVAAYLGFQFLNVSAPGLRKPIIDIDTHNFFNLLAGLIVNFGVLLILFIFTKDKFTPLYRISSLSIVLISMTIALIGIDGDLESKFSISRRLGSTILLILVVNTTLSRPHWITLAVALPATLTFVGQNYYFFNSNKYVDRTVGVSSEVFNLEGNYKLDEKAYKVTDMYRFNFDLITGESASHYPNSKGFHQYSPKYSTTEYREVDEKTIPTITFRDNAFVLAEATPINK